MTTTTNQKVFICEELGSAYWREGDEIAFAPLSKDGTYDVEESGIVETWDDVEEYEAIVRKELGME